MHNQKTIVVSKRWAKPEAGWSDSSRESQSLKERLIGGFGAKPLGIDVDDERGQQDEAADQDL